MPFPIDIDELIQGENARGFGQQRIIEMSDGTLYSCQVNQSNTIEVHKSEDAGETWAEETTFAGFTSPRELNLCISERGDLFLGFISSTSNMIIKRKHYDTGVWSEVRNVSSGGGTRHALMTFNRGLSRLHLVFTESTTTNYLSMHYSSDYGDNWNTVVILGAGLSTGEKFVYGVNSNPLTGDVSTLWGGTGGALRLSTCTSAGASHATVFALGTSTPLGGAVSVDHLGNSWSLYYPLISGSYFLKVRKNATESLSVDYSTTDTLLYGQFAMGIDNASNVYIFYVKRVDSICYYRKFDENSQTWGSETALAATISERPSCVQAPIFGSNKLRIIYTDESES